LCAYPEIQAFAGKLATRLDVCALVRKLVRLSASLYSLSPGSEERINLLFSLAPASGERARVRGFSDKRFSRSGPKTPLSGCKPKEGADRASVADGSPILKAPSQLI
jgi:hypothetical protein